MSDDQLVVDLAEDLAALQTESIGWQPLGAGLYLHVSDPDVLVVEVVGVPQDGGAVLLVGWN